MEEQKIEKRYSEAEAAELIGKTRITLWRYRRLKRIGYYRIGANIEYGESHIRQFLARCERKAKVSA